MECFNAPRVVITPGSSYCRAGFSGENTPRVTVPSIVGTSANQTTPGANTWYCGREALAKRSELNIHSAIEHGIVTNWDRFQRLLHHVFYKELKVEPEGSAVMLSEAPIGPKANREKTTQIMFETFNVRALFVRLDMVLSLIGSGRTTGTVISSGGSKTHIVPIYEGYWLPHAVLRIDKGGDYVTDKLIKLLSLKGYSLSVADWVSIDKMKESLAYVAEDYERELILTNSTEETYSLPDGRVVAVGKERIQCTESLFNPQIDGIESSGIADGIYQSIMKCDLDIRKMMYGNLVLSGGNTILKGMEPRVERELAKVVPRATPVNLISPPEREQLDWFGGALLSSQPAAMHSWITKDDYDEGGPSVVHRHCF